VSFELSEKKAIERSTGGARADTKHASVHFSSPSKQKKLFRNGILSSAIVNLHSHLIRNYNNPAIHSAPRISAEQSSPPPPPPSRVEVIIVSSLLLLWLLLRKDLNNEPRRALGHHVLVHTIFSWLLIHERKM
jgi:hypothetical protein